MPRPDGPTEYGAIDDLAIAAVHYFGVVWQLGHPEWIEGKILAGVPHVTAGAIERAIRRRNASQTAPLDTSKLTVGLRGWGTDGLVFLVEGLRRR